jgi:sulfur-oxidizing protein SoxA
MEDLVAFIANKSNGMKMDVATQPPQEAEMAAVGEALFFRRGGVMDFRLCNLPRRRRQANPAARFCRSLAKAGKQAQDTMASMADLPGVTRRAANDAASLWDCYRQQRWPSPDMLRQPHRAERFPEQAGDRRGNQRTVDQR